MNERGFYDGHVLDKIFPKGYELLPNTHEVFALDLAYGEYKTLSATDLIRRSAFFARINGKPTTHFRICSAAPLDEIGSGKTIWVKSFFQANRFSTGYATHSLFPYRGKFHPQLIRGILNITRVQEGDTLLDPMAGSGTACIEANLMNINAIGVDINPFCSLITKAKSCALEAEPERLENSADPERVRQSLHDMSKNSGEYHSVDDLIQNISITGDRKVDLIIFLSYLDAVGYARRRKTGSVDELFPIVLRRYVQTVKSFQALRSELEIEIGQTSTCTGDVLSLDLPDNSVDSVVTSPPYSFAIDYVENDRPQLELLGIDVDALKQKMIGLQGRTRKDKIANYFEAMDRAIGEMSRVLKPRKCCVIVVGSNEIQTGGIRHDEEFIRLASGHGLILFKDLIKSISGIQNSMREEHVLFFQKRV